MQSVFSVPNAKLISMCIHDSYSVISLVGGRTAVVVSYNTRFNTVQRIIDEHPCESFICCEFLVLKKQLFLAVAGKLGIIKLLNLSKGMFASYIDAHGASIVSIKCIRNQYLFSCSEDTTIKMWNINQLRLVCTFGGYMGHKDYVLSMDVSADIQYLASTSTDCTIRVWRIPLSCDCNDFVTPLHTIRNIHGSFIPCVKFYGRLILSSSAPNIISAILPKYTCDEGNACTDTAFVGDIKLDDQILRGFKVHNNTLFTITASKQILAFGMKNTGPYATPNVIGTFNKGVVKDFCIANNRMFILFDDSSVTAIDLSKYA
jgi:polycomb protein EED